MKGHCKTICCFLLPCLFAAAAGVASASSTPYCSFQAMGFYPDYYSEELPISQIRYDKLTDIIYFSVYPGEDGSLQLDKINRKDPNTMRDLLRIMLRFRFVSEGLLALSTSAMLWPIRQSVLF
jgi:hypothetical protein